MQNISIDNNRAIQEHKILEKKMAEICEEVLIFEQ